MRISSKALSRVVIKSSPTIDNQFDEGGFLSTSLVDSKPTVRINPYLDINYGGNKTQWWAIRLKHFGGLKPTFLIDKTAYWTSWSTGMWCGAWATAADTDTWYQFDNVSIGASDVSLSNNTPFPTGEIYVALHPLYPFSRIQRMMASWSQNILVGETLSTTNKIISLSSAVTPDGMGKAPLNLPYYAFKVANATANTKNNGFLTSGQHACEPLGRFAFEGAINWLLTAGVEQKVLLDWFTFFCYPDLYPLNIMAGHSRDFWNDYAMDVNRWNVVGLDESRDVYKAAFAKDTGGVATVSLDFHSFISSSNYPVGDTENTTSFPMTAYKAEINKFDPNYTFLQETLHQCLPYYLQTTFGVVLPMTQEHQIGKGHGISDWKTYGVNSLKALGALVAAGKFTYGPLSGARVFNGTTDRIDWASIYNPTGTATTISTWVFFTGAALTTNQYILNIGDANTYGMTLMMSGASTAGSLEFLFSGTAPMARLTTAAAVKVGVWTHILATYDGTFGAITHCKMYVDGTECTYNDAGGLVGTGSENAHTGSWSIGGQILNDTRNVTGRISQTGVWNRVLNSSEIAALASGNSPSFVPTNIKFCFAGDSVELHDQISNTLGVVDGTTQLTAITNGPAIGSRIIGANTTDSLSWTTTFIPTQTNPVSISFWVNISSLAHSQAFVLLNSAAYVWIPTGNLTAIQFNWDKSVGTSMVRASIDGVVTPGVWTNFIVTYSGDWTDRTHVHIYKNGVEVTYSAVIALNGSGTPLTCDGVIDVGSFSASWPDYETRGNIAQVGIWNSVIDAATIAGLAKGYAPSIYPTNQQFYFKGNTSDLHEQTANVLGVATGTTQTTGVGNGPTIYYP